MKEWIYKYKNYKYKINGNNCKCNSDEVIYITVKKIGEKFWDSYRKCELILDEYVQSAHCPKCKEKFIIKEV